MFQIIEDEAIMECDVCQILHSKTPTVARTKIKTLFLMGWARLLIPNTDKKIDVCENCLFALVHDRLNPSCYTSIYKIKESFNLLLWKINHGS